MWILPWWVLLTAAAASKLCGNVVATWPFGGDNANCIQLGCPATGCSILSDAEERLCHIPTDLPEIEKIAISFSFWTATKRGGLCATRDTIKDIAKRQFAGDYNSILFDRHNGTGDRWNLGYDFDLRGAHVCQSFLQWNSQSTFARGLLWLGYLAAKYPTVQAPWDIDEGYPGSDYNVKTNLSDRHVYWAYNPTEQRCGVWTTILQRLDFSCAFQHHYYNYCNYHNDHNYLNTNHNHDDDPTHNHDHDTHNPTHDDDPAHNYIHDDDDPTQDDRSDN